MPRLDASVRGPVYIQLKMRSAKYFAYEIYIANC